MHRFWRPPRRPAGDGEPVSEVETRTEERLARMIAYTRAGTTAFVYIPVFGWNRLQFPLIALLAAVAATVEAVWFLRRAWRGRTLRDPVLVWTDVAFCVILMLVGSRAAFPFERNVITTELVPFSLVAPVLIGLGVRAMWKAIPAVLGLCAAWVLAVVPHVTLKLVSDLVGFLLWYVLALLIGRELRTLARATAEAQRLAAEHERRAEIARQRELAHREIHDYLLPIVDHIADNQPVDESLARVARRGADRARRYIMDPRADSGLAFEALMEEVCDTFIDRGVSLTSVILVSFEPPEEVGEAIAAAAREALTNVLKHAGTRDHVNLFVESDDNMVKVVVRDRGEGFDEAAVRPGGGFRATFSAVRRHGGECIVESRRGAGTKVVIRWPKEVHAG